MGDFSEAAGSRLDRAPYACLVVTLCLYLVIIGSLARNPTGSPHTNSLLAVVAVLMILVGLLALLYVEPRTARVGNEALTRRWMLATLPFFVGYGSAALGAQEWVYGAGLVISVVLLIHTARAIRRSAATG